MSDGLDGDVLDQMVKDHERWLSTGGVEGRRADLSGRELMDVCFSGYDLRRALFPGAVLPDARFIDCKLEGADFSRANLSGTHFYRTDLTRAILTHAILADSEFRDGCILKRANMCRSICVKASFRAVDLTGAKLRYADLAEIDASDSIFIDAKLRRADLYKATLVAADLTRASLVHADLRRADLRRAKLTGANLSGANLREIGDQSWIRQLISPFVDSPLRLDSNNIWRTRFSHGSPDHWSLLRRTYTGSMLSFNVLFLALFLLPYFVQAFFWIAVNRAEDYANQALITPLIGAVDRLENAEDELARRWAQSARAAVAKLERDDAGAMNRRLQRLLEEAASSLDQSSDPAAREWAGRARGLLEMARSTVGWNIRQWSVWQLLLGLNLGYSTAMLTSLIIIYNVARGFLTYRVGPLRDEENRTNVTPSIGDYNRLFDIHKMCCILFFFSWLSFLWNAFYWLSRPVYLPG